MGCRRRWQTIQRSEEVECKSGTRDRAREVAEERLNAEGIGSSISWQTAIDGQGAALGPHLLDGVLAQAHRHEVFWAMRIEDSVLSIRAPSTYSVISTIVVTLCTLELAHAWLSVVTFVARWRPPVQHSLP